MAPDRWLTLLAAVVVTPWLTQCAHMPPPARTRPPALATTHWTAGDGKELPYQAWPSAHGQPAAILLCIHGLSGAASDFWPLGQELPKSDIALYGLQLRGQGNDPVPAQRGDILSASQWQEDAREFHRLIARQHPGVPIFWLGESMGSLIALNGILGADSPPPSGLILLAPAVGIRDHVPGWKYLLVRSLGRVMPGKRIPLSRLDSSKVPEMRITSEATQSSNHATTPHFVAAHSLRLLLEIDRMMHGSGDQAKSLQLPVLVLYTPNDPVASREQIEEWFGHVGSRDKTRLFFERNYHLILHDADRWEATRAIGQWILHRRPAR